MTCVTLAKCFKDLHKWGQSLVHDLAVTPIKNLSGELVKSVKIEMKQQIEFEEAKVRVGELEVISIKKIPGPTKRHSHPVEAAADVAAENEPTAVIGVEGKKSKECHSSQHQPTR
uniref:Uncharacterized protein n=1 Tax=Peronospora matthiolae TaxID=2874970 RepID=A0AAV1UDC6_9STRA